MSDPARVRGQPRVMATMVVDAATGLVRGMAAAATARKAHADAMRAALTKPAGPLPPQAPDQVLCARGHSAKLRVELARLLAGEAMPPIVECDPIHEAEDLFDAFIGHIAGRRQPDDVPTPLDWETLVSRARSYSRAQPWLRWSDVDYLNLVVTVGGVGTRYLAVVLGQEGIQRGLALYPGTKLPEGLHDWQPGTALPLPAGTLLLWLDPPDEVPPEFAAKAARYGWPADEKLLPIFLVGGPEGPADLDLDSARQLTLAITAVLAHDQRPPAPGAKTTGDLDLPDGPLGTYAIS